MFPRYAWLRRYRPGRRLGPLQLAWSPDHLPWPQLGVYRGGCDLTVSFWVGPLGPDPVLSLDLVIQRPCARRAIWGWSDR
jgi:hypothetical protein